MDLSRRRFVAAGTTLAAAGTAAAAGAAAAGPPQPPKVLSPAELAEQRRLTAPVSFRFDVAAFQQRLRRPVAHRQVVSATSYQSGSNALGMMQRSIASYEDPLGFGAGPNSLHAACVMYAGVSPLLALDDAMYAKYPLFVLADKDMHPDVTTWREHAKTVQANGSAAQYRELAERHGASFFLCNHAFTGLAWRIAQLVAPAGKPVTREQVVAIHDELAAHLLPGTMLVPTGVAALNAVQEERFTFLAA